MPSRPLPLFATCLLVALGPSVAEEPLKKTKAEEPTTQSAPDIPSQEFHLSLDPNATKVTFELGATGHTVRGDLFARGGELHLTGNGRANGLRARCPQVQHAQQASRQSYAQEGLGQQSFPFYSL